MLEDAGPGSLKLIVTSDDAGAERALRERVGDGELRRIGRGAWIAYTDAEPAAIRDWLAAALSDGGEVFVVEFERWSLHGDAIDPAWLLRRGH